MNGRVELNVTATDKGTPPLSTTVPVIINIEVSLQQFVANLWHCVAADAATPGEDDKGFLSLHSRMLMTTNHISKIPLIHSQLKKEKRVSIYFCKALSTVYHFVVVV